MTKPYGWCLSLIEPRRDERDERLTGMATVRFAVSEQSPMASPGSV